jgi:hypothetical protein
MIKSILTFWRGGTKFEAHKTKFYNNAEKLQNNMSSKTRYKNVDIPNFPYVFTWFYYILKLCPVC